MLLLFPPKNYSPLQCRLFQECSFIFAPVPLLPRCPVSYLEVSPWPSGLCESRRPAPCFPQPVLPSAAVTALQYQVCVGPGYCVDLSHSFIFPIHCSPPTKRPMPFTMHPQNNINEFEKNQAAQGNPQPSSKMDALQADGQMV